MDLLTANTFLSVDVDSMKFYPLAVSLPKTVDSSASVIKEQVIENGVKTDMSDIASGGTHGNSEDIGNLEQVRIVTQPTEACSQGRGINYPLVMSIMFTTRLLRLMI